MGKNNEEYSESSERYKTFLNQFVYCKRSQPCIHKSDIYWGDRQKLKNINSRCWSNELAFNLFNSFLSCSYNNVRANFIKSVGIYQLLILQFTVSMAEGIPSSGTEDGILNQIQTTVTDKAKEFWGVYTDYVCKICNIVVISKDNCKYYVAIPVIVFLFLFVFGIICLICCKCCCKKSRKKKASEDSNVNHDQFIMGPDGQMYSQMCQGQMMQPQMIPAGMMYPQMYPGQMFYPQMLQQGMQQPEMLQQGMQQPEMQYLQMQQPEMQYLQMQQPEMQYLQMQQPEMHYMEMQQPEI